MIGHAGEVVDDGAASADRFCALTKLGRQLVGMSQQMLKEVFQVGLGPLSTGNQRGTPVDMSKQELFQLTLLLG